MYANFHSLYKKIQRNINDLPTLMLTPIDIVFDLLGSKLNPIYVVVDEYLKGISNKDDKSIHSTIHSNINYVTDRVSH